MSGVYERDRKEYRQGTTLESNNADGDQFAEWLTGAFAEEYASKLSEYCKAHKNCEDCRFYNGVCRLNSYPWDWDMKKIENTP